MTRSKPHIGLRLSLIAALVFIASCDRNPLVRVEASIGLSPAPFERFTGMRTIFSGMTAAAHDFAHLDFIAGIRENILSPVLFTVIVLGVLNWHFPKATPQNEGLMLAGTLLGSILVNTAWSFLN